MLVKCNSLVLQNEQKFAIKNLYCQMHNLVNQGLTLGIVGDPV